MHYFPVFMDLQGREIIVCGGGEHAADKIKRLLPFGAVIRVISENISDAICRMEHITVEKRRFCEEDLQSFPVFVIAAEDRPQNERISELCRQHHIPVNAVDMQDLCDFIFPCVIAEEKLCIGISTGGASPAAAVALKKTVSDALPDRIDEILDWIAETRIDVRKNFPDKGKQHRILRQTAEQSLSLGRPLTDGELLEIINISVNGESSLCE